MKWLLAWFSSILTGVFIKKWKSELREDVVEKPMREFWTSLRRNQPYCHLYFGSYPLVLWDNTFLLFKISDLIRYFVRADLGKKCKDLERSFDHKTKGRPVDDEPRARGSRLRREIGQGALKTVLYRKWYDLQRRQLSQNPLKQCCCKRSDWGDIILFHLVAKQVGYFVNRSITTSGFAKPGAM